MTDLFDSAGKPVTDPTKPTPKPDDNLAALVGDGKQYKTEEDLAYAHRKANEFIKQLQDEGRGLRQELEVTTLRAKEQETMQELIARMESATGPSEAADATSLSSEEVLKLVTSHVDNLNDQASRKANRVSSNTLLLQHYNDDADKARQHLEAKATELRLSMDTIAKLSEQSPTAFAELMGIAKKERVESGVTLPHTEQRPENDTGTNTDKRNYAYYKALRKELGIKYWNTDIQQQLMKDATAQGPEFYT